MLTPLRALALSVLTLTLTSAAPPSAHAEDCSGRSVPVVVAPGAAWTAEVRWDATAHAWLRRAIIGGVAGDWRPLPDFDEHAHLVVFVPRDPPLIAVLDAYPERRLDRRLLVQTSLDGLAPATFRAYGLVDLLTPDELVRVRHGAHIEWLGESDPPWSLEPDGRTLSLQVLSGRRVRVPIPPG